LAQKGAVGWRKQPTNEPARSPETIDLELKQFQKNCRKTRREVDVRKCGMKIAVSV
jgi:hypothetical protein